MRWQADDGRSLSTVAHAHKSLPEFPVLCPAAVTLALPSMIPVTDGLDDTAPVLALCPSVLPMAFSQVLDPDHSIPSWLTAALLLAIASWVTESLAVPVNPAVIPVLADVSDAPPVVKKGRQATKTSDNTRALDKTPRRRSPKTAAATAATAAD
ncbi:MAG: hypothetical protein MH252_04510 [Thermosynechococcaceae cyanobacterium MS004]|nr:hypothetical protein [Thermosynechococcaceae cyanobacterium MS004]